MADSVPLIRHGSGPLVCEGCVKGWFCHFLNYEPIRLSPVDARGFAASQLMQAGLVLWFAGIGRFAILWEAAAGAFYVAPELLEGAIEKALADQRERDL